MNKSGTGICGRKRIAGGTAIGRGAVSRVVPEWGLDHAETATAASARGQASDMREREREGGELGPFHVEGGNFGIY